MQHIIRKVLARRAQISALFGSKYSEIVSTCPETVLNTLVAIFNVFWSESVEITSINTQTFIDKYLIFLSTF